MLVPRGAVIIINNDLTDNVKNFLIRQLFISEVLDGYVFDDIVSSDENYLKSLYQLDRRVMVIRDLSELNSRDFADVVVFFAHGLVSILENKFGPRGLTFPVVDLTWTKLCVFK